MAGYLVILSHHFTETRCLGSADTNNLDTWLYNHNINDIRHGLYFLDYIIAIETLYNVLFVLQWQDILLSHHHISLKYIFRQ